MAFKALDAKGMPAKVAGRLLENGKDIAKLESVHDGMGFVFILPIKGASYKAVLSDGREFPFAEVVSRGCPSICVNRRMSIWSFFFPNRKGLRRRQSSWKAKCAAGFAARRQAP